jgi:hypothetical protein
MLLDNVLAHYYDSVQLALRKLFPDPEYGHGCDFSPGPELPDLTAPVREYLSASCIAHTTLSSYRGKELSLLDLARNPTTMTTKTFPSLVIVARAVRYIRDYGERVTIITPSSANKATALRDAVLRAFVSGLVTPDQLNIVVMVPARSAAKLRSSELFTNPGLRARNPVALYHGDVPGDVKLIASGAVEEYRNLLEDKGQAKLWYTLRLENYLAADVIRALAEAEFFAPRADRHRLHVHAVSSAYGLLGHAYGQSLFRAALGAAPPARYFLVQHLGAPDMVVSLYGGQPAGDIPGYSYNPERGLYTQEASKHFPEITFDPKEELDPTFYTRNPPTSTRMNELIHAQGGGGLVVSLAECLKRYGQARSLLCEAGIAIPANPMALREWSSIMAVVGTLNAIDRDLIPENDIVIHGSGSYSVNDFECLPVQDLPRADDAKDFQRLILKAAVA